MLNIAIFFFIFKKSSQFSFLHYFLHLLKIETFNKWNISCHFQLLLKVFYKKSHEFLLRYERHSRNECLQKHCIANARDEYR